MLSDADCPWKGGHDRGGNGSGREGRGDSEVSWRNHDKVVALMFGAACSINNAQVSNS